MADFILLRIFEILKEKNIKITSESIDNEYKQIYSQLSPAYLNGSSWYVGESIVEYYRNNFKSLKKLFLLYGIANYYNYCQNNKNESYYIAGLPPQ